jgi:sugar phosphate isomerase/epimerase
MIEQYPPTDASISTMWGISQPTDLNSFFHLTHELGFQKIELNHQISAEVLSQVHLDHCQFSSIHEPCPMDTVNARSVQLDWIISSQDESFRKLGVKAIKNTIKLAHDLLAPTVVIHCGNVTTDMSYENRLRTLFTTGKTQSDEYQAIKTEFINYRNQYAGPRIRAVRKSLVELIEYAEKLNVKLGLENRYHYMDIPTIDEMEELLSMATPDRLGFIYDVGHAQALDRLGFFHHNEWINRFGSRIFGTHLHDVIGLSDHLAPGLGEIDFKRISTFLPEDVFRTLELKPGNTIAHVISGLHLLVDTGCIRYRAKE